ncbi:DUF1566 domain-containing protein [Halosquirtibacter laminarini]|uniref:DUF1566 domain-containing protein n=1 Tax=Halosquirtibacter laminarini TaxID=3374600 RepID=A0AC61NBV8_9BACT|nr:DUF1566 domain-containing protein [Prolixibacteraceae bacterium]
MKSYQFNHTVRTNLFLVLLVFLLSVFNSRTIAQNVSISDIKNAPADVAAVLDVYSKTKGILVPRVELKSADDPIVGIKPNGLLIYNTVASDKYKVEGFYFWKGSDWMPLGQDIYEVDPTANFISSATSASNADFLLDQVCLDLQNRLKAISTTAGSPAMIQASIEATRIGAGLDATNGHYTQNTSGHYINASTSINEATNELDKRMYGIDSRSASNVIAVNSNIAKIDEINKKLTSITGGSSGTQDELDRSQRAIGLETTGAFKAIKYSNYVSTATTIQEEVYLLDKGLHSTDSQIANMNVILNNVSNSHTALQDRVAQNETDISGVQDKLKKTITGAGLSDNGQYAKSTSSNYINSASSLFDADKLLDAKVKENKSSIDRNTNNVVNAQSELDRTQASSGLNSNGSYTPLSSAHLITSATSLQNESAILDNEVFNMKIKVAINATDIEKLKTTVGGLEPRVGKNESDIISIQGATNNLIARQDNADTKMAAIITGTGLNTDGTYSPDMTTTTIKTATSLADADKKLDKAINDLNLESKDKFGDEGVVQASKAIVADSKKEVKGYNKIVVGSETATSASAAVEISSTSQGFLLPRQTTDQISNIKSPVEGLVVYNLTQHIPVFYDGSRWRTYKGRPMIPVIGDNLWGGVVFEVNETSHEVLIVANYEDAHNYNAALLKADNYTLGDYTDWKLPTKEELRKLNTNYPAAFNNSGSFWANSEATAPTDPNNAFFYNKTTDTMGDKAKSDVSYTKIIRKTSF